jgi:uncharacterized protein
MPVLEKSRESSHQTKNAVRVVDCDVHPMMHHTLEIADYATGRWKDHFSPKGNQRRNLTNNYYDSPDFEHAKGMRTDSVPPDGGFPGTDPAFAYQQLLIGAGVDFAILQPAAACDQLLNPDEEHAMKEAQNNWLADVWLDQNNGHERWKGSIYVTHREPEAAAREIERWAEHPHMVQVLMTPQTRGVSFGDPKLDPIYEAASRHGLPVATHLSGISPFELTPLFPVGNPSHWADFLSAWSLLFAAHLESLVFDGALDRFPDLNVVFVEGAFAWALPLMWRMDALWEHRAADLPEVRKRPSDYVRDQIWLTTQPLEDVETSTFKRYLEWMDASDVLLFSTDYPHWTYDDPAWSRKRFPEPMRNQIMYENALRLFDLPSTMVPLQVE